MGINYHLFQVGTAEFNRYGLTDQQAVRLLDRWIRRFWDRYAERTHAKHPGSIADAINNRWYGRSVIATVVKWHCESATCPVIPCTDAEIIAEYEVPPKSES
jgi:hypothetical protein